MEELKESKEFQELEPQQWFDGWVAYNAAQKPRTVITIEEYWHYPADKKPERWSVPEFIEFIVKVGDKVVYQVKMTYEGLTNSKTPLDDFYDWIVDQQRSNRIKENTASIHEVGNAKQLFEVLSAVPRQMKSGGMKELSITSQGKVTWWCFTKYDKIIHIPN